MSFDIHYLYFVFVIFLVVFGAIPLDSLFKKRFKMNSMEDGRMAFDPTSSDDPVAMLTEWTPVRGGGDSFRTHKIVTVNPYRMEFQISIGAKMFSLLFLLIGLGDFINISFTAVSSGKFNLGTLLGGLIFACTGGAMLYFFSTPIVFDKIKGAFWKGRKAPDQVLNKTFLKDFAQLDQVHALQLISEYISGAKSSYHSYELNLVLKNGQRINVVDHGNQNRLREDAANLSAFLQKPVWDAT